MGPFKQTAATIQLTQVSVPAIMKKLQGLMGTFMQASTTIHLAMVSMPTIMEKLQGLIGTFMQAAATIQLSKGYSRKKGGEGHRL